LMIKDDEIAAIERQTSEAARARRPADGKSAVERKHDQYEALTRRFVDVVEAAVPSGSAVLVVSRGDETFLQLRDRQVHHFPLGHDGRWGGHPAGSHEAIAQLESMTTAGTTYLAFPASAVWWFEHYPEFRAYLDEHGRTVADDPDTAVVFEIGPRMPSS
jgi:hypothetical protein